MLAAFLVLFAALTELAANRAIHFVLRAQKTFPRQVAEIEQNPLIVYAREHLPDSSKLVERAREYSDKALHFGVSAGLAGGGYAVSALLLGRPWQRAVAGGTFSLTLGAAKELYDLSGHGDPSWRDFTWDVIGTAVGLGVALLVDAAVSGGHSATPRATATRLAFAF